MNCKSDELEIRTFGLNFVPNRDFVRVGEHDVDINCKESNEDCVEEDFKVAIAKKHELYQKGKFLNDIAILKLEKPVKLSESVSTICLPITENQQIEKIPKEFSSSMNIAGW